MPDGVIDGLDALPEALRGGVATIGNFDGVHLGHRKILQTARSLADATAGHVVALTFEPPPDLVVRPADRPQRLTPPEAKCALLRQAGADWVVLAAADRDLLSMTAEAFIEEVLLRRLAVRHVVEGRDFFFGRGRAGTVETLRRAGERLGFACRLVEPVVMDLPEGPQRVSSTLIRGLLAGGRVEDARRCLGRDYTMYGPVVAGRGHGRKIGFPTANVDPGQQAVPADGVYAGWAEFEGARTPAAISVGDRPTLGGGGRAVEAHLLGVAGELYGRRMTLGFVARLREQKKFDGDEPLRRQIEKDLDRVRQICG